MTVAADKHYVAGLIIMLKDLGIYTMYSEDVTILAAVHKYGPGFADD